MSAARKTHRELLATGTPREILEAALDIAHELDNEGRRAESIQIIAGVLSVIEGSLARAGLPIPRESAELTRRLRGGDFTLDQEGEIHAGN